MERIPYAIGAALCFVAGCLAVFGVPLTAVAVAVLAAIVTFRSRLAIAWGLAAVAFWWAPLHEYQDRIDALGARVERGGPDALTARDLAGIWLLNVGMAVGGAACGFPEVALETLLLAVPGPDVRVFRSDFAMASPDVRAAVDRLGEGPQRVTFAYHRSHTHARVGLALNPVVLSSDGDEIVARVPVDYPPRARLVLLRARGRTIVIDEGLFHALEARGWLFPYTAEWRWRKPSG